MKRIAFVTLLILSAAIPCRASSAADPVIERSMKDGVPGAAIVVVKDGAVVHQRVFGVTSAETKTPVAPGSLFRLGSTTKMFVALATLKLADAGKLRLDQPVGELVRGLHPALQKITIEQLLTHTSGLSDDAPMSGPLDESALHQRVAAWGDDVIFAPPGEVFSYANTGYVLLGDVIAHVSGKPFSAAMKELVLDPAGMKSSTFLPLVAFTSPVALGHDSGGVIRPFAEHAGNYPPGSLFTSVEDLAKFFTSLSWATIERLGAPRVAIPVQNRHYGYGLMVDDRRGPRVLLHTGARSGYGSTIVFVPSQKLAIAVMGNRTGATLSGAALAAVEDYVRLAEPPPAAGTYELTDAETASLAGTYVNGKGLPTVELVRQDGTLVAKFLGRSFPVRCSARDRCHAPGGMQMETFGIVRDGKDTPKFILAETWALRKRS